MTGKQRAVLKALAAKIDPVVYIGKEGISDRMILEADIVLEKRELIKVQVQDGCDLTAREASEVFSERLGAESVLVIGKRFVIYRKAKEDSANLI